MSDWLRLDCPFCRCRFRIKAEHGHLKGRCPECGFRIAAPRPNESRPAPISDSDEPLGLVPMDDEEEWPEPGLRQPEEAETGDSYGFSAPATPAPKSAADWQGPRNETSIQMTPDTVIGVYTLAEEPKPPPAPVHVAKPLAAAPPPAIPTARPIPKNDEVFVIAAPAEPPAVKALAASPPPAKAQPDFDDLFTVAPPAAEKAPSPAAEARPAPFQAIVDPLFLDEIAPAPKPAAPPAAPAPIVAASAAPLAKPPVAELADGASDLEGEGPAKPKKKKRKKKPTEEVRTIASVNSNVEHNYKLSDAELNPEREEPLPDDVFLTGVFGFPFKPRNLGAWLWIAFGAGLLYLMAVFAAMVAAVPQFGIVGAGFLFLGMIWVLVLLGSYSANAFFGIVADTANGADEVSWPEGGWKEWFFSLLHLVWLELLAGCVALPFYYLTSRAYGDFAFFVAEGFIFPILVLSSLANEWTLIPINGKIFGAVGSRFKYFACAWLLIEIAVLPLYLTTLLGNPWWLAPVYGVAFGYAWIVRGRLIGRLGRVILELDEPNKKKRKKKKRPGKGTADAGGWGGDEDEAPAKPPVAKFAEERPALAAAEK